MLRQPDEQAATGRISIGVAALVFSACGLMHIAHGTPVPADGAQAMAAAGGWVGWLASAPIVAATHPVVAALLLLLLAVFGVLVVTETPVAPCPSGCVTCATASCGVQLVDEPLASTEPDGAAPPPTRRATPQGPRRREEGRRPTPPRASASSTATSPFETPLVAEAPPEAPRRARRPVDDVDLTDDGPTSTTPRP